MVRAFSDLEVYLGEGVYLTWLWLTTARVSVCLSCRASTAFKVGAGMSDDGMMHSDHRPVFVDLTI